MILSFDTQLQVALRALGEVVAPALGQAEKHVQEQLHLAIATLGFVKTRLPEARRWYRMELGHYIDLAEQASLLAGGDAGLDTLAAEGVAALASATADIADYETITRHLRDAVTALVDRCAGSDKGAALDRLVLDRSGDLLPQYRQWAVPFGLELKPDALPAPAW